MTIVSLSIFFVKRGRIPPTAGGNYNGIVIIREGGIFVDFFDIIGPVMIGPSSSHTAGAARIGRVARDLLGETPARAEIGLYGSFEKTYQGHGTDRALVGGLMGMSVDDPRLRDALSMAAAAGMQVRFAPVPLRAAHPNTVVLHITGASGKSITVRAASVGGGRVMIQELNGLEVNFSGEEDTLIIRHHDAPGAIARVTGRLAEADVNIATMRVFRKEEGGDAIMALELDKLPGDAIVESLRQIRGIYDVTLLKKR